MRILFDQGTPVPLRRFLTDHELLFCDNHKTAHDREAYREDPAAPRLMVRLWLNG